jgi:putative flavoprotein involved in K+ transport
MTNYEVAVIGAGWAGVAVSRALQTMGIGHVVYERNRICETWRTQRWTSFRMNTPNVFTVMPGDRYLGEDPESFMTCDEFIDIVERYARRHELPILENTPISDVCPIGNEFGVQGPFGTALARSVVIATGNLNQPRRPKAAGRLPMFLHQIDGSQYRYAGQLPPGAVLVVGCGNSGGQIAEDLVLSGRSVFLSTGRNGRVPRRYRGRDIILWLVANGRMAMPRTGRTGRALLGATHTISLQSLSAQGVTLLGRFEDVLPDGTMTFADSLGDSIAFGDEVSREMCREIDAYIEQTGIDAPEAVADKAELAVPQLPDPPICHLQLASADVSTVIWSTGFGGDFTWVRVPGAIAEDGSPVQKQGLSVPGIYFAGLDGPESLAAGTIHVADEESQRIAAHIKAWRIAQ